MNDVIYRKDVLNLIPLNISAFDEGSCLAYDVEHLPSAQKKGHWVKAEGMMPPEQHGGYFCSECEELAPRDWRHYKLILSSYCPHCGADMRGEDDG